VTPDGVEVAVLGPVRVRGAPRPFHRAAARELVVYLAFHREGVRHDEWALALWPDRPVAASTVYSTASDARRALGRAPDGAARLPSGSRLRLHGSVTTDVDRFAALARSGRWTDALRLVRGPLFGALRRSDWAVLDGTLVQVESSVVHAVLQGADALLSTGRGPESEWLVRRGLVVSPYDERLYRALLRALAAQGNRLGLRAAMAQLLVMSGDPLVTRLPAGWERASWEPRHPETSALYRELLGGCPATGGEPARL
jgi:DNA-binding SARP family transcriptional activator